MILDLFFFPYLDIWSQPHEPGSSGFTRALHAVKNEMIGSVTRIFFCLLRHRKCCILTRMYTDRGAIMNKYKFLPFAWLFSNKRAQEISCSWKTLHFRRIYAKMAQILYVCKSILDSYHVWVQVLQENAAKCCCIPYLNFKIAAHHYARFSLVNMTLSWLHKASPQPGSASRTWLPDWRLL